MARKGDHQGPGRISTLSEALQVTPDEARVVTLGYPPYQIVHTNKRWYEITGYRFAEVANLTSSFLQGPDTEWAHERQLAAALSEQQQIKVTLLNYTKAGIPFFNTLECFPLRDSAGNLTHFCGTLVAEAAPAGRFPPRQGLPPQILEAQRLAQGSQSSSKRSQGADHSGFSSDGSSDGTSGVSRRSTRDHLEPPRQRPRRSGKKGARLADAVNNTTDAVVLTEPYPPYAITHVNQPWCEMCGYTQEEVQGQSNSILHGPETDQSLLDDLMSSVSRGEPTSATLVNYKKGGQRFVNQVQVMPVYNDDDELEQFMAMLHEI